MGKRLRIPTVIYKPPPPASVDALYQQAKAQRAAACQAEINAALKRHNCKIDIVQQWLNGQSGPMNIICTPLDAPAPNGKEQEPA